MSIFKEMEATIGGRPKKKARKVKMYFYVTVEEREQIKELSEETDLAISSIVRLAMKDRLLDK